MKKLFLFFTIFLFSTTANADELCDANKYCRKVCDLKMTGKYSDLNPDHRKLILKCADDFMKQKNN